MADDAPFVFFRIQALISLLATNVAACVSTGQDSGSELLRYHAPAGAVMPEGGSEIRTGMTSAEVQRILGALCQWTTGAAVLRRYSTLDVFEYAEGGEPREIRIPYVGNEVVEVYFGLNPFVEIE